MGKWILLMAVLAPGYAQEKKPASLTALDYIEIQQLVNRYGQDIDTCTNNGYDYADLYTTDGVFIDKYSDDGFQKGGVQRAKGRDELAAASWGGSKGCKGGRSRSLSWIRLSMTSFHPTPSSKRSAIILV